MSNLSTESLSTHQKGLLRSAKCVKTRDKAESSDQAYVLGPWIASNYTNLQVATEKYYKLLPSEADLEVQLQTTSGQPKKKLSYNFGAKEDYRIGEVNPKSDARVSICRHGDIISSRGFGEHQLRLICSTETGKPAFAYLTGILDIDIQLRERGYWPTAQDALEQAYQLIAQAKPELALTKCSKKRARDDKPTAEQARKKRRHNASRRVSIIHPESNSEVWLNIPHSHEISFNNQEVVFREAFRGLDPWQVVIRLSEETQRLGWDEEWEIKVYELFASALNMPVEKLFDLREFFQLDQLNVDNVQLENIPDKAHILNIPSLPNWSSPSCLHGCRDCCQGKEPNPVLEEYGDLETLIA